MRLPISNVFESYEGEGPKIGLKTLFCTYDKDSKIFITLEYAKRLPGFYVMVNELTEELFDFLAILKDANINISIDCPVDIKPLVDCYDTNNMYLSYFLTTNPNKRFLKTKLNPRNYIYKIEIHKPEDFEKGIIMANRYVKSHPNVFIMPLFKEGIGDLMMQYFDILDNRVRMMPPTQVLFDLK